MTIINIADVSFLFLLNENIPFLTILLNLLKKKLSNSVITKKIKTDFNCILMIIVTDDLDWCNWNIFLIKHQFELNWNSMFINWSQCANWCQLHQFTEFLYNCNIFGDMLKWTMYPHLIYWIIANFVRHFVKRFEMKTRKGV